MLLELLPLLLIHVALLVLQLLLITKLLALLFELLTLLRVSRLVEALWSRMQVVLRGSHGA